MGHTIDRRTLLRTLVSAGAAGVWCSFPMQLRAQTPVRYEVYGSGPALILAGTGPRLGSTTAQAFLDGLTDSYRVILLDFPPRGEAAEAAVDSFTADRVCADMLAVADSAGAERFAFYGYSWGGSVSLQLAERTDRLTALICGGWPPLGTPYNDMSAAAAANSEADGRPPIFETYYRDLIDWPERAAIAAISCPRMTFAGRDDVIVTPEVTARIGPLIAEHEVELERMGWSVRLVEGFRHELGTRPDVIVPVLREFLDPVLLGA